MLTPTLPYINNALSDARVMVGDWGALSDGDDGVRASECEAADWVGKGCACEAFMGFLLV